MACSSSTIILLSLYLYFFCAQADRIRHDGHNHHLPYKDGPKNVLKDKDFIRDYEHIKEDLQDQYNKDFSDRLDAIDLEIYYFQLHDLDGDQKLDGLEMLAALNHVMEREEESHKEVEERSDVRMALQNWWNDRFEEDAKMIDQVFKDEDLDQDGYLSYEEFALARQGEKD